jgi:hypothetical protein
LPCQADNSTNLATDLCSELHKEKLDERFGFDTEGVIKGKEGLPLFAEVQLKYSRQGVIAALCAQRTEDCVNTIARYCRSVFKCSDQFSTDVKGQVHSLFLLAQPPQLSFDSQMYDSLKLAIDMTTKVGHVTELLKQFPVHGLGLLHSAEKRLKEFEEYWVWRAKIEGNIARFRSESADCKGCENADDMSQRFVKAHAEYHGASDSMKAAYQQAAPDDEHAYLEAEAKGLRTLSSALFWKWLGIQEMILKRTPPATDQRLADELIFKLVGDAVLPHGAQHLLKDLIGACVRPVCSWALVWGRRSLDHVCHNHIELLNPQKAQELLKLTESLSDMDSFVEGLGADAVSRFGEVSVAMSRDILPPLRRLLDSQMEKPFSDLSANFDAVSSFVECYNDDDRHAEVAILSKALLVFVAPFKALSETLEKGVPDKTGIHRLQYLLRYCRTAHALAEVAQCCEKTPTKVHSNVIQKRQRYCSDV